MVMIDSDRAASNNGSQGGHGLNPDLKYAPILPDTIKVGHFVFSVCADKSKLHDQERKGRRELYGACNFDKLEIVLDPVLPLHLMRDTLWHEIVHALFWLVGFDGKKTEEEYTRSGASLQLTALRDNPILVAYLMGP